LHEAAIHRSLYHEGVFAAQWAASGDALPRGTQFPLTDQDEGFITGFAKADSFIREATRLNPH
jgi:hypothetical protein